MSESQIHHEVSEHARTMAARSWEKTPDRAARTSAGRKAALETFARRRAEKAAREAEKK